jgi:hypothetical protein
MSNYDFEYVSAFEKGAMRIFRPMMRDERCQNYNYDSLEETNTSFNDFRKRLNNIYRFDANISDVFLFAG